MNFEHLVGLDYREGKDDCYGLVRRFYADLFGIELPNYARPRGFAEAGVDLLGKLYYAAGFRVLDVHPSEYRFGDCFLISIRNTISNHCGVLVDGGKFLHHLFRNRSRVDRYGGLWRNNTLAVLRHKDNPYQPSASQVDLMDLLPDGLRRKLAPLVPGS